MEHLCWRRGGLDTFHSAEGVGPSQYLMTLPVQMTKPKLTSKPLPALSSISKLVLQETRSDAEDHQRIQLTGGGDNRRLAGTDVVPINHLVWWFQAISANMNVEAQRRAIAASQKAASSVFANERSDEGSSNVQGDLRRVEYSAEMAEIGFPSWSGDERDSPMEWQNQLDQFRSARGQSDFRLPHQSAVEANLETKMGTDGEVIRRDKMPSMKGKEELEQLSWTTGLTIALGR